MKRILEQETQAYDRNYELENRLTLEWYPKRVAAKSKTGSMLELGLGHGYSTQFFSSTYTEYTVVEGSPEMIERFRSMNDAENLDIVLDFFEDFQTDKRYDAIGMGFVLEHVNDPAEIIRRYANFLAPDGLMFIAVPNAESLHRRLGHEAGLLPDILTLSQADREFGHQRYFTLATLRQLIEGEGLVIKDIEGLLLKPVTTQQLIELNLDDAIWQAMLKVGVNYPELSNSILVTAGLS